MADTVVWRIIDGNLPFLYDFPTKYEINYTSDVLWQIEDSNLPFKKSLPYLYGISDTTDNVWRIIDGDHPFKLAFPPMPQRPRKAKKYKGKHSKIIIPIYKQTIPVGKVLRSDPPG